MRIAWIGNPGAGGGVPGFARDLLVGLTRRDEVEITLYTYENPQALRHLLGSPPSNRLIIEHTPLFWHWNKWYSRHHASTFFSGLYARTAAHQRLVRRLRERNAREPYDLIMQFSQWELLSLRSILDELPPVVLFPCTHAAGELLWHRAESATALQSERWIVHHLVRANLRYRAAAQRRDAQRVSLQFGMSRRFNELVRDDYGISSSKQAVVYQPMVELANRTATPRERGRHPADQVRLIFVGRIAVRKGIDQLVALTHRISDLAGKVTLDVIGGPSFWSNYTGEVAKLNNSIARFHGPLPHDEILRRLEASDILLVPSRYEPGGIVVAEALSAGCIVVASDEVGSAEMLAEEVCLRFPAGNIDAFEFAVRDAIKRIAESSDVLRTAAKHEASTKFDLSSQVRTLLGAMRAVVRSGSRLGAPQCPIMST